MNARALLGTAAGTAAWAALAGLLPWSGFLALLVGILAGAGSRWGGARGHRAALLAAAYAAAGTSAGLGFASRVPLEHDARARADRVDRADYEKFGRAAADWKPGGRGVDPGKFAQAWDLLPGSPLDRPGPRVAEFLRTTAPQLDAWKKKQPEFEEWRAARRAAILAEADAPWTAFLRSPLRFVSVLDLVAAVLGIAAAAKIGFVPAPAAIVRKKAAP